MNTIRSLLRAKGHQVWSIGPDETVFDAIRLMAEKGIGALMVVEDSKLVGVMSERDYARQVILQGRASQTTPVRDIMTRKVISVRPPDRVEQCLALMTEKRIRHLPVLDEEKLVGVVSIGDLVRVIIEDQRFTIEQLTAYVSS